MSEAIHEWFGLTYSNYLTLPRSLLQSMPDEWQERFVKCLEEMRAAFSHLGDMPDCYTVNARAAHGKFAHDPYADYERGRRVVMRDNAQQGSP